MTEEEEDEVLKIKDESKEGVQLIKKINFYGNGRLYIRRNLWFDMQAKGSVLQT